MCAFVPALQQIISGNADDPTRDMSNWNSIVNVVNGQLDDTNIAAGANIAISKTALGTYTAWTAWTPTFYQHNGTDNANASLLHARYCQIGKTVYFEVYAESMTNTAAINIWMTLPVTSKTPPARDVFIGCGQTTQSGVAYIGYAIIPGGTDGTRAVCRAMANGTWAANGTNGTGFNGFYETA